MNSTVPHLWMPVYFCRRGSKKTLLGQGPPETEWNFIRMALPCCSVPVACSNLCPNAAQCELEGYVGEHWCLNLMLKENSQQYICSENLKSKWVC